MTTYINRRAGFTLALAWFLVGVGLPAPSASAQDKNKGGKGKEKVAVQVWTIRAAKSSSEVSPELKGLAEKLKKQFKYTGYKLVGKDEQSVEIGQEAAFALTGPYKAAITPTKKDNKEKRITLRIRVTQRARKSDTPPKLDTTVTLPPGEQQLVGGWELEGGDVLIIAVSAK